MKTPSLTPLLLRLARRQFPRRRWDGPFGALSLGIGGGTAMLRLPGLPIALTLRPGRRPRVTTNLPWPLASMTFAPLGPVVPGTGFVRQWRDRGRIRTATRRLDAIVGTHDLVAPALRVRFSRRAVMSAGWYEPAGQIVVLSHRTWSSSSAAERDGLLRHIAAHVDAFERDGDRGHGEGFRRSARSVSAPASVRGGACVRTG